LGLVEDERRKRDGFGGTGAPEEVNRGVEMGVGAEA